MNVKTLLLFGFTGALSIDLGLAQITATQALMLREISDVQVSPSGDRVVFTVSEPRLGIHESRHLWMADTRTLSTSQFTDSARSEFSPRWSPDRRKLAFLSDRDASTRIYVIPATGGPVTALTPSGDQIRAFEWAPDSERIAYIAMERRDLSRAANHADVHLFGSDALLPRLRVVDVASGSVHALLESWQVSEVQWLPSQRGLVVRASDNPDASERFTDRICLLSLPDARVQEIAAPKGWYVSLSVSPEGSSSAYRGPQTDGPIPHDLFLQPLRGGPAMNVTATRIDKRIEAFVWTSENSFLALAQNGFSNAMYEVATDGASKKVAAAGDDTIAFDARAGVLALVKQSWTQRPELWISVKGSQPRQVTNLNAEWRDIRLLAPERFRFRSFDGVEIEAAVLLPPDYKKGTRLPAVVFVHGGPPGRWSNPAHTWGYPTGEVLASHGYAVLYPNIRGSSGYGQKFIEMNRGDLGGGDFKDIMAGVDYLIQAGIADADRLGIAGWSYGGYLTMSAVTQTNRFKAALAGGGWSNWLSEFGTNDIPHVDAWWFPETYKQPEAFVRSSPITYVANVRTPLLLLHGDADRRDPIGESEQFYRALKWQGLEAVFVVYPREGHPLREGPHIIDSMDRTLAWFDKYLKW